MFSRTIISGATRGAAMARSTRGVQSRFVQQLRAPMIMAGTSTQRRFASTGSATATHAPETTLVEEEPVDWRTKYEALEKKVEKERNWQKFYTALGLLNGVYLCSAIYREYFKGRKGEAGEKKGVEKQ